MPRGSEQMPIRSRGPCWLHPRIKSSWTSVARGFGPEIAREAGLLGVFGISRTCRRQLDPDRNARHEPVVSVDGSGCMVRIVSADENLMIARHPHAVFEAGTPARP